MKQYITIISTALGIILVLGGGFASYATLTADQKNTQEKVEELKKKDEKKEEKLDKVEEDINEIEKINLEQSMVQERIMYVIDKLEEKVK